MICAAAIDVHEPEHIRALSFGRAPVLVMPLEAGDVMATCADGAVLSIERKTATDLLNTLGGDRLFPQLTRLRNISPWAYLVITGELRPDSAGKVIADGRITGWNYASVTGALLTAQELGVMVLHIASDNEFEQAVIRLAQRNRGGLLVPPPREGSLLGEGWAVIAALPGIGIERVKTIREYCRTPAEALSMLTETGKYALPMKNIGEGVRARIRRALELEDGFFLNEDVLLEHRVSDKEIAF